MRDAQRNGRHGRVRPTRERAVRGPRDGPRPWRQRSRRATRARDRAANPNSEPPDRRPRLRGSSGHALLLQPERLEPSARRRNRRPVQRAHEGRALVPQHGHPGAVPLLRSGEPPAVRRDRADDDRRGRTVPFIVQRVTGTAARGIYQIAVLVDPSKPITPWSTSQPEPQALLHLRRRVWEPARPAPTRQRASSDPARARLRRRDVQPQHLCQQLQRRHLR